MNVLRIKKTNHLYVKINDNTVLKFNKYNILLEKFIILSKNKLYNVTYFNNFG